MTGKNSCELCGEAGLSSRLLPYQMNTEEAILICENSECVFPLGTARVGNFVVSRKATEISNTKRKRKKILSHDNTEDSSPKSTSVSTPEHFVNWQNVDALCWLDCALSLLVHNQTLKYLVSTIQSPDSLLRSVLDNYAKAQQLVKSDLCRAKKMLDDVRHSVWTYLAPKMKCALGVNDSPIFALPLLLRENVVTLEKCLQEYTWEFGCSLCGYTDKTRQKKHIVTFPNTPKDFDLQNGSFLRTCPKCNSVEQKSIIVHEKMPEVVLMHFVEGLKSQDYLDSKFTFHNSTYQLTQFLQYSRNPDHFICWTKETNGTRWLELDDLKPPVCSWTDSTPTIPHSEVHVVVFEKMNPCRDSLAVDESQMLTESKNRITSQTEVLLVSRNKEMCNFKPEVFHSQENKEESDSCHMDTTEFVQRTSNDTNCTSVATPQKVNNTKSSTDIPQALLQDKTLHQSLEERQKEVIPEQINQDCKSALFDLQQKLKVNECSSPTLVPATQVKNISGRFPLMDCSNTPDNSTCLRKTVNTEHLKLPSETPFKCSKELRKTPLAHEYSTSSLLNSPSLANSLIKVTLKRHSCCKRFQPLLNNKRRALSSQFQPYVPKKQRIEEPDKAGAVDFDHQSDSGYSSPSSVSSCGSSASAASIETDQKISGTDDVEKMDIDDASHENIAEELEKLLPDCLLNDRRKRIPDDDQLVHSGILEVKDISQEQDDFIKSLLFND